MSVVTLDAYPDPDARERELEQLAAAAARRIAGVEVLEYGHSVAGRPLRAVRVGRTSSPRVLVCANTHGPEFIGNRVCVALLRELAERSGSVVDALLERAQLWLVPCINPDGYARTYERAGVGELPSLRHNENGVDLNRNWPLPEGARRLPLPGAGSMRPGDATYCGPQPLSEPETASLDRLLGEQDFRASANLHSFMGTLFPARVQDRVSFARYKSLCNTLSRAQPRERYRWLASRTFDTFTGEQEDHQHHHHRCWSVCVESFPLRASFAQHLRAPTLFWRFNPHDPTPWIENDLPGIVAYLLAALELPRPGEDELAP